MLNVGEDPNHVNGLDGSTPLFRAAASGSLEAVKLLVEAGADVNHQNYTNSTALHVAYKSGAFSIALYLLLHGANDFVLNNSSRRPSELDQALHRRVLSRLHTLRRSHKAALEYISRLAERHEAREQQKRVDQGLSPTHSVSEMRANMVATNARDHEEDLASGQVPALALQTVDLTEAPVIHRTLLCPRGRVLFHFFADGRPVLMSHVRGWFGVRAVAVVVLELATLWGHDSLHCCDGVIFELVSRDTCPMSNCMRIWCLDHHHRRRLHHHHHHPHPRCPLRHALGGATTAARRTSRWPTAPSRRRRCTRPW
jgi:hypothetical protein